MTSTGDVAQLIDHGRRIGYFPSFDAPTPLAAARASDELDDAAFVVLGLSGRTPLVQHRDAISGWQQADWRDATPITNVSRTNIDYEFLSALMPLPDTATHGKGPYISVRFDRLVPEATLAPVRRATATFAEIVDGLTAAANLGLPDLERLFERSRKSIWNWRHDGAPKAMLARANATLDAVRRVRGRISSRLLREWLLDPVTVDLIKSADPDLLVESAETWAASADRPRVAPRITGAELAALAAEASPEESDEDLRAFLFSIATPRRATVQPFPDYYRDLAGPLGDGDE